ncbi:hypothetical protein FLI71_32250, partial [Pseudomonas aeruginosa]
MPQPFRFQSARPAGSSATEANIFIHGYSAGHSDEDKQLLLDKIPEQRNRLANSPLSTQTSSDKNGWKTKPCP